MAENSQCFPVSPNQGGLEGYTQEDVEEAPPTHTVWGQDKFSCLRSGEPLLKPRGTT